MTEEHQTVDQVGTDETGTTSDCTSVRLLMHSSSLTPTQDPLAVGVRQETHGREVSDGGVLDGVGLLVVG